ncbi:MAG: DUF998 domain-containing protein [Candidatus Odinarchaeota archaeon]|nr:DUF998 domain-containing protein [Candidatus Thorarchaeota archaeon]
MLYCSFTFSAWALYPDDFAPWSHYLSRLGNFNYSPLGAYFYNLGCILAGITLIFFFVGLQSWDTDSKIAKGLLILSKIIGVCASFALILIGVFSEDQGSPHLIASSTFFLLNFIVLILINIALLLHNRFIKAIGIYGIIMTLLSLPLEIYLGGPLIEWYTVFGSLVYVGLLSYNIASLNSK